MLREPDKNLNWFILEKGGEQILISEDGWVEISHFIGGWEVTTKASTKFKTLEEALEYSNKVHPA